MDLLSEKTDSAVKMQKKKVAAQLKLRQIQNLWPQRQDLISHKKRLLHVFITHFQSAVFP